jgi:hypothetical protein
MLIRGRVDASSPSRPKGQVAARMHHSREPKRKGLIAAMSVMGVEKSPHTLLTAMRSSSWGALGMQDAIERHSPPDPQGGHSAGWQYI